MFSLRHQGITLLQKPKTKPKTKPTTNANFSHNKKKSTSEMKPKKYLENIKSIKAKEVDFH